MDPGIAKRNDRNWCEQARVEVDGVGTTFLTGIRECKKDRNRSDWKKSVLPRTHGLWSNSKSMRNMRTPPTRDKIQHIISEGCYISVIIRYYPLVEH